jgi:phage-related minor tail protein
VSLVREFELAGAACVAVGAGAACVAVGVGVAVAVGVAVFVALGFGAAVAEVVVDAFEADAVEDGEGSLLSEEASEFAADGVSVGVAPPSSGASVVLESAAVSDATEVGVVGEARVRFEAAFDSPIAKVVPRTPKLRIANVALVPYLTRHTPLSEFVRLEPQIELQT